MGNRVVAAILRSPFSWMLSKWVMLISVTGRKTGRRYTLPIQYVRRGQTVYALSRKGRNWWRNVAAGGPVSMRLGGRDTAASAEVLGMPPAEEVSQAVRGTWIEKAIARPDSVLIRMRLE